MKNNYRFIARDISNIFTSWIWACLLLPAFLQAATYHVDPLSGSMDNAGTSDKPWSTLEAVFAANKTFAAGDSIVLLRGNHGGATIKGKNSGMVTIAAATGHTPVFKWIKFSGARFWTLQDVYINPQISTEAAPSNAMILIDGSSTDNVIKNCSACSTQDPYGWRADEQAWLDNQKLGMHIKSGGKNQVSGVYLLNVGNGLFIDTASNLIEHTIIENFTRDGWAVNGDNNVYQYNMILNAIMTDHTKDGRINPTPRFHRDMVQSYSGGGANGVVFRGNIFVSQADPSLPVAGSAPTDTGYMAPAIPAFAGWDGPFRNRVYENNVIFTDSPAGIWLNNATNCRIVNNTVSRVSTNTNDARPLILIKGSSTGNMVYNNIADGYDMTSAFLAGGNALSPSNITVRRAAYAGTFLSQAQPGADLRLKSTATAAIGKADASYAPAIDADGNARDSAPDIGAYEQGHFVGADSTKPTTPGKPRVIVMAGLGSDLLWLPSSDNRLVAGYDIYRNGAKVGRSRNGSRFFDLHKETGALQYTIVAFDRSGNQSAHSEAGAPDVTQPVNFSLIVNSGSGSGIFPPNTTVSLVANPPAANMAFEKWTGDTAGIADIRAMNTTIITTGVDLSVTATYVELQTDPATPTPPVNPTGVQENDRVANEVQADTAAKGSEETVATGNTSGGGGGGCLLK